MATTSSCSTSEALFSNIMTWIQRSGGYVHPRLRLKETSPRGVIITGLTRDESDTVLLFKVPKSLHLTPAHMNTVDELKHWKTLISDATSQLAAVILFEKRRGRDSPWYNMFEMTPGASEFRVSLPYIDDPRNWVKDKGYWDMGTFQQLIAFHESYHELHSKILHAQSEYPIACMSNITFDEVIWARSVCITRSFEGPSLIPGIDMLNHDKYASPCDVSTTEGTLSFPRTPPPNEEGYRECEQEVFCSYGTLDAIQSWTRYGFISPYTRDILLITEAQLKVNTLGNSIQANLLKRIFGKGVTVSTVMDDTDANKKIEVLTFKGYYCRLFCNPEPSMNLMILLRIFSLKTLRDFDKASEHDFKRPLSLQNEIASISRILKILDNFEKSINVDTITLENTMSSAIAENNNHLYNWAYVLSNKHKLVKRTREYINELILNIFLNPNDLAFM